MILTLILVVSCTERTKFGPCVGMGDDNRNPNLIYKLDGWNLAMGLIFVELIVPPIIVLANETYCPVGVKEPTK